jgi:hypothetical protein
MTRYNPDDEWIREHYDIDAIEEWREILPFELVHALLEDITRLHKLVESERAEVNMNSAIGIVYDIIGEGLYDGTYYDHPAFARYFELYGDESIVLWEL